LLFFAGLFLLVGSLVKTGVIGHLANALVAATGDSLPLAMMLLLWGSAALSAIVDNIPFVATMAPVVDQLVNGDGPFTGQNGLWWALLLGADLGGNATAIGASANVVVTGISKKNGHPISFWEFTRYGSVVAVVTLAIATPYLLLRY
jgi:Na+/H+ antiporter NhaD/arsenite permease-like protein